MFGQRRCQWCIPVTKLSKIINNIFLNTSLKSNSMFSCMNHISFINVNVLKTLCQRLVMGVVWTEKETGLTMLMGSTGPMLLTYTAVSITVGLTGME